MCEKLTIFFIPIQSFGLSTEKVFEEVKALTEKLAVAKDEKIVEKVNGEDENSETEIDSVNWCSDLYIQEKIAKAKERYDKLCDELQTLQTEREQAMSQNILAAMKKSGRSYDELMTFLQVS